MILKVLDATNTTLDRRDLILDFAKENGYKVRVELASLRSLETLFLRPDFNT